MAGPMPQPVAPAAAAAQGLAETLGAWGVQALLAEARLSPKPGLVDGRGVGAHDDMDLALMCGSAVALGPAFVAMAAAARAIKVPGPALREALGVLGRAAEATMLASTGGVNTHRGAIWALGLLVGAAAIERENPSARSTAALAATIARHPDRFAPRATGHPGERACLQYRVAGARGQAQAGFPHVIGLGLPELRRSRARGDGETSAQLNSLLAIMSRLDDTCVLSRCGPAALAQLQQGARAVLDAGGAASRAGRRALRRLDADAAAAKASPGGAADLLAATLFLDRLEARNGPRRRARPARRTHADA